MPENLLELENILEESEDIPEHEALVDDSYRIEVDEHYLLHPERLEIQDAIKKCSERDMHDPYSFDPNLFEVEEAMEEAREIPPPSEEQLRYMGPEE
jgi:hypothetical protein